MALDLQLAGKRALVTGSSSGIGAVIARSLAAERVRVVIHGRDEARARSVSDAIVADGHDARIALGDLASEAGADEVVRAATAAFGGIDILVNNAGGISAGGMGHWFDSTPAEWLQTYDRNVVSAVRLARAFAPAMRDAGWGRIVNIGTAAAMAPTPSQADYAGSKAAMLNMSLSLSKALRNTGVTSNTVSPGMIRTEGLADFLRGFAASHGMGDDVAQAEETVLRGTGQTVARLGECDDIAYAVLFLASPLSGFINGVNIHVDGGSTAVLH